MIVSTLAGGAWIRTAVKLVALSRGHTKVSNRSATGDHMLCAEVGVLNYLYVVESD